MQFRDELQQAMFPTDVDWEGQNSHMLTSLLTRANRIIYFAISACSCILLC